MIMLPSKAITFSQAVLHQTARQGRLALPFRQSYEKAISSEPEKNIFLKSELYPFSNRPF